MRLLHLKKHRMGKKKYRSGWIYKKEALSFGRTQTGDEKNVLS
jgi:hypothetical protein